MLSALAGGSVLVEKTGSEPFDVVALHGWGRSAADFSGVLEGMNAASVQLPGHGVVDL